jgi:ribosomal protein L17
MKKIVKLTESDLQRIIEKVISEEKTPSEEKKRLAMKHLRKISDYLKNYDVEKEDFPGADMTYLINMFEKIADHQDIKL